jgi:hypothetical protein
MMDLRRTVTVAVLLLAGTDLATVSGRGQTIRPLERRPNRWLRWLCCLPWILTGAGAWAQAPLTVDNISDRATYDLKTWFRVPTVSGYRYRVLLDGQLAPTDLTNWVDAVDYHELLVSRSSLADGSTTNRLVRFIVQSERGNPEKGLIRWTPYPAINSTAAEFAGARLRIVIPAKYPMGLPIPVVAWVDDESGTERRANGLVTAPGYEDTAIRVRRGVGSVFLPAASQPGTFQYEAQLQTLLDPKTLTIEPTTSWTAVSGILSSSTAWPAGSRIFVKSNLTVSAGVTLTINAGSVITLNPLVNITNRGRLVIDGTAAEPVVFTATNTVWPERNSGAWGGFIVRGSAAELIANSAIVAGGGGATSFDFAPGSSHRSEQAVLLLHSGARAWLTNCYILNTAGQVGNGYNSDLTLDHCLFQRAVTAGEYVGGTITISHSALIEFPADNGVVEARIADADYDAIYFTEGTHILNDSLFGFAMDDAIDSGSGGTGTMLVTNCWIESALHEAQAWSGGGRTTWTHDTVALNCGQGIESGWSTGDNSPNCFADRLLSTANAVGARIGDNYDWSYNGFLRLTNSLILYNYRDLFIKTWNVTGSGYQSASWVDRASQLDLHGNWMTTAWTQQPGNWPWSPAEEGWRLAHWMTTPPGAPVGIGWAVWTNQFPMADMFAGVPVRLSSFTTNAVSVGYAFASGGVRLSSGRLTFAPGETLKRVYPVGFDVHAYGRVDVVLENPIQAELTGLTTVGFTGNVAMPRVSCWVATNNLPPGRLAEGMLVQLSAPAGQTVTVDYFFSGGGTPLASGTLTFLPGETAQWVDAAGLSPGTFDPICFSLGHAQGAALSGITSVTYGTAPVELRLAVEGNQLDLVTLAHGLPFELNRASANIVTVDFQCEGSGGILTNGTLTLTPGQTRSTLTLPTVLPGRHDLLRVSLTQPRNADLLAPDQVVFLPFVSSPSPTLVLTGSAWRYLDTGADGGTAWRQPDYDDSGWSNGLAQLGFGDHDETTPIRQVGTNGQNTITFYFRQPFVVENPTVFTNLAMTLLRDDGGVVYLNGAEVYLSPTLPPSPALISYRTLANALSTSDAPPDNTVDRASLSPSMLVAGTNLVAVEIHQHRNDSSDVSFDFSLTGEPVPPPPPQRLHYGRFGGLHMLVWEDPGFALETADAVAGPWTRVPGALSPWGVAPSNAQAFFRLRR